MIPLGVFAALIVVAAIAGPSTDDPTNEIATEEPADDDEAAEVSDDEAVPPASDAPVTTVATPVETAAPEEPADEAGMTPSQANALRSAEAYLDFSAFSRQGLIDQLSSEFGDQFPLEDATIAVDSLDVDWNEQAAKSAEAYLEFSAFSCQGLIDQLSSEFGDQYAAEQATFGAESTGIC